jgi:UrcA family protein
MIKFTAATAMSALLLAVATPALADDSKVAVPYGDLNLASTDGATTLDGRLVRASKSVCGESGGPMDAGMRNARARCRAAALDDARGKAKTVVAEAGGEQRLASAH